MPEDKKNWSGKADEHFARSITRKMTLDLFRAGADPRNYHILHMLPTTMACVMKELSLSKMPANRRINDLEKVGLVKRARYRGEIHPTPLTKSFKGIISDIQEDVMKEIPKML
ncbi:hypothetical protein JW826_02555 [Candidatus Woesearchaeota archaeon]|nr:hypothetical protein [Candidatus Woesearchaeota archaeon]